MSFFEIQDVKRFYNQIGWQVTDEGFYQNARYEDLRPVSKDYIHKCHLRINRHISLHGKYFLDAGSGPIQYPEYLTYSQGYQFRICLDISHVALREARDRIGAHGLYMVADVSHLPIAAEVCEGIVSLHTLHHLPFEKQKQSYGEFNRVLCPSSKAVIINGWQFSPLMHLANWLIRLADKIHGWLVSSRGSSLQKNENNEEEIIQNEDQLKPSRTYVNKVNARRIKDEIGDVYDLHIYVWRSVSVRFLRVLIHPRLGGRFWLSIIYWMEERFPGWFGENGQYPLIVLTK